MTAHVATFDNIALTAAADILYGTVAADKPVELMEFSLGNFTDLADAGEEVLRIGLFRGVTGGSGGTGLTEVPINGGEVASSLALLSLPTTSTAGTQIDLIPWNIRVPLLWCPIPELRPIVTAALDPFAFRLMAAPTDSVSVSGTLKWRELT